MAEQTLTGFLISKAMQSRKEAKKEDRKEKRKKKDKNQESDNKQQGIGAKLSGGLSAISNIFSGKKPSTKETPAKKQRSTGNSTGLAKILSSGFGSLTADNLQLSSGLASITQLLNNSYKAQSFTATGVQTISAILSDQLENQSSILSTVKSLKSGGGGSGGKGGGLKSSKSAGVSGQTLTGFLIDKFGNKIQDFIGRGLAKTGEFANKLLGRAAPQAATQAGGKAVVETAEAAAKKKLAQEVVERGLSSKGAMIGGRYVSVSAAEASQILAAKTPKVAQGPLAKLSGMIGGHTDKLVKGAKGFGNRMMAPIAGRVAGMTGGKVGGKTLARLIPGAQTVLGLGFAGKELMEGDIVGAGLALGSAIPGPVGWGFLAADVAREVAGPQMVDKAFGQAIGGQIGFTDQQIADREKNMSATERAFTTMSGPSFMGLASGGMTLGKGLGNVMVGEAAGGSKGEAVVPLSSGIGKQMMGAGNSGGDPGMQTSAGSTLAVVDQFIKGMGPLGAPVAQALGPDIQQLSRKFGMSQTLPNLRIGGGKFKEDGNAKKNRDKFLEQLISGSLEALDAKKKDNSTGRSPTTPQTTQEQRQQSNPDNPDTGSVSQRQQNSGSERPMDDYGRSTSGADHGRTSVNRRNLRPTEDTQRTIDFTHKGDNQRYRVLLNYSNGDYEVFKVGAGAFWTDMPVDLSNPKPGGLNEALLRRAHNEARYLYSIHAPDRGRDVKYLSPDEASRAKSIREAARHGGEGGIGQARGGDYITPTMPKTSPSTAPIGATNIANSQTNSVSVINIIGGSSGGGTIPVSSSSSQDSSQYISDPFPGGLAGVLCMSPWSVV